MQDERIRQMFDEIQSTIELNCTKEEQKSVAEEIQIEERRGRVTYSGHYIDNTFLEKNYRARDNEKALNTIRDLGQWYPNMSSQIEQCVQCKLPQVRYAALEALTNGECDKYNTKSLITLWEDNIVDQYWQIMVYRTMVQCPSEDLKWTLWRRLLKDPVNQATSYIWTHLSNIHEQAWTTSILQDSRLLNKFMEANLRFSRNFRKDVVISDHLFRVDFDVIFSGEKVKPQFLAVRIVSNDTSNYELFNVELREKNVTTYQRKLDPEDNRNETSSFSLFTVRVMGNEIYKSESLFNSESYVSKVMGLYSHALELGLTLVHGSLFTYLRRIVSSSGSDVHYNNCDFKVQYTTSIGMPFNIHLNFTKGYHTTGILSSYAREIDGQFVIDATYANVGCKYVLTTKANPFVNISGVDEGYEFVTKLPKKRNELFEVTYSVYNIENNLLVPKYYDDREMDTEIMCIPAIRKLTGSTFCWEYSPQINWWPLHGSRYRVVYVRGDDIKGHRVYVAYQKHKKVLSYEALGNADKTFRYVYHDLAQFVNVSLETPCFSLHGTGVHNWKVLNAIQSGQAMNISGTFMYNDESAPFTMIGKYTGIDH